MLQPITRFTLEKHEGPYETWGGDSLLLDGGVSTGVRVPGYAIEAQYALPSGYLLITSYDCPMEEVQEFLLLSPQLRILDQQRLGAMYGSFLLIGHRVVSEDTIELRLSGEDRWRLRVLPGPRLSLRQLP